VSFLQGNEGRQVWTPAYRYYEYIESTNLYRDAKALGKKRCVFAGNSAGSMTSQFAALDFKPAHVRGVYLFGMPKVGNRNFQVHYNFVLGGVTRAWWNRFNPWIEVPAADATIAAAVGAAIDAPFPVNPVFQRLDNRRWWRIDLRAAEDSATACQRMTADPALAAPCPGIPTDSPACELDNDDHGTGPHVNNIKACALASTADTCVANLDIITL
jgi:pimeloyl-ACP methyl ester carboxylesterase